MCKYCKLCAYTVKVGILAGFVGAIATGCTSFATPNVQQGNNNANINTPSQTVQGDRKTNFSSSETMNYAVVGYLVAVVRVRCG
jgi:hypothetical protein